MRARLILKPGQRGTKKLCAEYGERLVCVRYRYDEKRRKRLETVELVVDEVDWEPREPELRGETIVGLRVAWPGRRWGYEAGSRLPAAAGTLRDAWGSCATTACWPLGWRTESSESWTSSPKSIYM